LIWKILNNIFEKEPPPRGGGIILKIKNIYLGNCFWFGKI